MQLKWSSSCGYNFNNYLELWNDVASSGNGSARTHPTISATLESNITVITAWLGPYDARTESDKAGRIGSFTNDSLPRTLWE
jgi:hypothetical protein